MSVYIEKIKFNNIVRCTLKDPKTNEIIQLYEQPNTVVNVGKQLLLDNMGGINSELKHGAVGRNIGATSNNSILLGTELGRNPIIYSRIAETGTFSVFFGTTEVSGDITEIGYFGGTSSYTSVNTGIMFNRILLSTAITKNNLYTLTVDLDVGF